MDLYSWLAQLAQLGCPKMVLLLRYHVLDNTTKISQITIHVEVTIRYQVMVTCIARNPFRTCLHQKRMNTKLTATLVKLPTIYLGEQLGILKSCYIESPHCCSALRHLYKSSYRFNKLSSDEIYTNWKPATWTFPLKVKYLQFSHWWDIK